MFYHCFIVSNGHFLVTSACDQRWQGFFFFGGGGGGGCTDGCVVLVVATCLSPLPGFKSCFSDMPGHEKVAIDLGGVFSHLVFKFLSISYN